MQSPPNFQLVADELLRLYSFSRSRSNVEAYVKKHLPKLIPHQKRKKKTYRRFRCAFIGELWQHDSSSHQWWEAPEKQLLLLTVDDASGMIVAGRFVDAETTWNHFFHFRSAFEAHGLPESIYTDGLSLFGASGIHDANQDPRSQFQRALMKLGVGHLVAPTPQAKGKIERRFGTFQRRMLALLAYARVKTMSQANEVLQMEIERQNHTAQRSTGFIPATAWREQIDKRIDHLKPLPSPTLLDLHLSLRCSRRVNNDSTIDFDGVSYEIAPTKRKRVTVIFHPKRKFWVLEDDPDCSWSTVLGSFTL